MVELSFPIEELEYFLLIMTRITCFIYIAPFFGTNNVPARVKIGLGAFMSILVYYVTMPHSLPINESILQMTILILKEAAAGLLIGLGANLCMSILSFAGRVVDTEMGLSMASQYDPLTKTEVSITGQFYQYTFMLIMLCSGLYQYFLSALADTFVLIPVGFINFDFDSLMESFVKFLGDYMIIGMRICLPVFCTIMVLNCVLGILAKIAPQMNMFAVGIQIKVLTGLTVLFLTVGLLPKASDLIFTEMKKMVVSVVEGLMNAPI